VLPRLEEWDYAADFLQYERELAHSVRDQILSSLNALHAQTVAARDKISSAASSTTTSTSPSRTVSPAPSASASSESSGSTHTATPYSPRLTATQVKGKGKADGRRHPMKHLTPTNTASSSSQSISSVTSVRTVTQATVKGTGRRETKANGKLPNRHDLDHPSDNHSPTRSSRPQSVQPPRAISTRPPSTLAIFRSYLDYTLSQLGKSKFVTFVLLLVILPLISIVLRRRRRKMVGLNKGAVEDVRRRLRAPPGSPRNGRNVFMVIWQEIARAITDTVKMGGHGLV